MAISVDTVYQRVLAIANKEQRGFITPQEFNLFANQAQMDIFEKYFYDLKQFEQIHGNDTGHSDIVMFLQEKLSEFEIHDANVTSGTTLPNDLYRISNMYYTDSDNHVIPIERITKKELHEYRVSPLPIVTASRPVFVQTTSGVNCYSAITITGTTAITSNVKINYYQKPTTAYWGYVVVPNSSNGNEFPLFNAGTAVDFQLHPSEENFLVLKILELAGFSIKSPEIVQGANTKIAQEIQQKKQ